jgi:hypothetical protein
LRAGGEDNTLDGGSDDDLLTSAGNLNNLGGRDGCDRLTAEATADIAVKQGQHLKPASWR